MTGWVILPVITLMSTKASVGGCSEWIKTIRLKIKHSHTGCLTENGRVILNNLALRFVGNFWCSSGKEWLSGVMGTERMLDWDQRLGDISKTPLGNGIHNFGTWNLIGTESISESQDQLQTTAYIRMYTWSYQSVVSHLQSSVSSMMISTGCLLVILLTQLEQLVMYMSSCSWPSKIWSCASSIWTVTLQLPGGKETLRMSMQASPVHWSLQLMLRVALVEGEKAKVKVDS